MNLASFAALGLSDGMLDALKKKGYEEPTEIQRQVIPLLLSENCDIAGQAQTGTGKTGAFGIPLIDRMAAGSKTLRLLILTPTRELAIQVAEELNSYKGKKKLTVLAVYGGQSMAEQISRIEAGVDIIAGTPGRVLDHIKRKTIDTAAVETVVIDEADEMLAIGFADEMDGIMEALPSERRTLLFSATMPHSVLNVAQKHLRDFKLVSALGHRLASELTDQIYFEVNEGDRFEALCRILDTESDFYGLIFCRTKTAVDELAGRLIDRGYNAEGLHGDFSQNQRERTLAKFKKRRINILVASDVAARGIDVVDLTHVINYSLPHEPEAYIHRIGRTGRAGKRGVAVTFISPSESRRLMRIEKAAGAQIQKRSLPTVKDIVSRKLDALKNSIDGIIDAKGQASYTKTARRLLDGRDAVDVVAALVKHAYAKELDETKYKEIKDVIRVDKTGTVRLFVSLGKKDGLNPKKLLKMINNETKVPAGRIRDVHILDSYSFVTAGFKDAETILKNFKRTGKGQKPALIKKANDMKQKAKAKPKKRKE